MTGRISGDAMGEAFMAQLAAASIDTRFVGRAREPSPLAFVTRGTAATGARYAFYLGATAYDTPSTLPSDWTEHAAHLHIGSFSATDGALGQAALEALRTAGGRGTTSYDPNIRPFVVPPLAETLPMVEERVRLSTYVKSSEEDFDWLYPGTPPSEAAARWAGMGPKLVVMTKGEAGAEAHFRGERIVQPAPDIAVSDTVGAGDSFMSGLLAAMAEDGCAWHGARPERGRGRPLARLRGRVFGHHLHPPGRAAPDPRRGRQGAGAGMRVSPSPVEREKGGSLIVPALIGAPMHRCYRDILDRIADPPSWFDDYGVPRYSQFSPTQLSNIFANEAALAEVSCQSCGRRFRVALTGAFADRGFSLGDEIRLHRVSYGDPPNVECCGPGLAMGSVMHEVLQYWFRNDEIDREWRRDPTLEGSVSEEWLDPPDTVAGG